MQRPVVAALKARAAGFEARAPRAGEQSQARLLSSGEAPRPRRRTQWLLERLSSARHHARGCRAARSRGAEPYRAAPGFQGAHVPCACLQTITGKVKCKCFPATARHRTHAGPACPARHGQLTSGARSSFRRSFWTCPCCTQAAWPAQAFVRARPCEPAPQKLQKRRPQRPAHQQG